MKRIGYINNFFREGETFPVFQALLNAVHRGVKLRILTNDFNDYLCPDTMDLLLFLQLAGSQVRFYTTTTFFHNKFMLVDGKIVMISSVNYSECAFMKNREAGMIIYDSIGKLAKWALNAFEVDFNRGYTLPSPPFNSTEMRYVTDKTPDPVIIPDPLVFEHCSTKSPNVTKIDGVYDITLFASPDTSHSTIMGGLGDIQNSLELFVYQITSQDIADKLLSLVSSGVHVKVLVSSYIYDPDDRQAAMSIYKYLKFRGLTVRMTHANCLKFSHQKFWIADNQTVWLSSGNYSPSDIPPPPSDKYPPHGDPDWRRINRDMNIKISGSYSLVQVFRSVLENDFDQGYDFYF